MFVYRPPKSSCWGHSIREGPAKLDAFLDAYFERVEAQNSTALVLAWKDSVLPKVEWPEVFLGPDSQKLRQFLFIVRAGRVMFPMGIQFPISPTEPASFEFLGRFSADAPFKISARNFQIGIPSKNGKIAWRKPDAAIAAKLKEIIVGLRVAGGG